MALQVPALAMLLALPPLMCAWEPAPSSPSSQEGDKSPGKCQAPDSRDRWPEFRPKQPFYNPGATVTWRCSVGFRPSVPNSTCTGSGTWSPESVQCDGFCTIRRNWFQLMFTGYIPTELALGKKVQVSCRQEQFEGGSGWLQCVDRAGRPEWNMSQVNCIEKCRRPQWDPRLQFAPDQQFYRRHEAVRLSCLDGTWPSPPVIRCVAQYPKDLGIWTMPDIWSEWRRIEKNGTCVDLPQISPPEISPTSIRLSWACKPIESCQGTSTIWAKCQADVHHKADPCWEQGATIEWTSKVLEGTFTCSHLQPFSFYNVTIFASTGAQIPSSSAVLYRRRVRTKETGKSDPPFRQPQIEPRDPSTGSLRWKQLPSCHGDILGYQLNITAWRENDDGFLEEQVVQVNPSVTEYRPPHWRPGTNYTVTVQGLTAAGLGKASQWAFETDISGKQESKPAGITPGQHQATASNAGQEHHAELQPQDPSDISC
ncbi:uncharacterized protein LOC102388166 [Alligator sinensis]|uniref:Uncharacterized protein LOC102388166 n=1 Tax=Alligator sinensis TaxID=38654 RepID=A0A3Q0FU36_ALLSI|nr:uncharacterized protein LOC102388166 [Alligator sinensis]